MSRARKVVEIAADLGGSASRWLRADEKGVFEKLAGERIAVLVPRLAELRAAGHALTEDDVDVSVARELRILALEALIRSKRRGRSWYPARRGARS